MKKAAPALSILGLLLTICPSLLVFAGRLSWQTHANLMLVGMVFWFATAPFWIGTRR
jgi:hypothetical protein